MAELIQLFVQVGAVAVLTIGLAAIIRGDLRTKQELNVLVAQIAQQQTDHKTAMDRQKTDADAAIARLDARLIQLGDEHAREFKQVRDDCDQRLVEVIRDREYYRDLVMKLLLATAKSATVTERLIDRAEKSSDAPGGMP